jgi:2'-hydroxyisoflavone reductase
MDALIIGGTLFIGRELVRVLLRAGHRVTVMHRRESHDLGAEVDNLAADRNDPAAVRAALEGRRFDLVFDNVYDWERGTTADQVEATVRACGDGIQRYVFMSSVAAYGGGLDHLEEDELAGDDHPEVYVRHKAASERRLFELYEREGFPIATLRPPFVYGPENPFYREQFFWDRLLDERPIVVPEDGARLMQFVFVRDLAAACLAAAEVPEAVGQAFNVADPSALLQHGVVGALAAAAGRKARIVHVPRRRIEALGGGIMQPPLYFGFYLDLPPITTRVDKARRILGFRPTPLAEGLSETFQWYLGHRRSDPIDYSFEDRLIATSESSPS